MAKMNTPSEQLAESLMERRKEYECTKQLVKEGVITRRLGDYMEHLLILDLLKEEVEVYLQFGEFEKARRSLYQMECRLDGVSAVLLSRGKLETERINGITAVKNIDLSNMARTKELYDLAKERYNQTLINLETEIRRKAI